MLLLGASGDLTSRLLMPAIAELAEAKLLPPQLTIVGSARTAWSTAEFRQHIATQLARHSRVAASTRDDVVSRLDYQATDVTRAEDVRRLVGGPERPGTLVYLALAPSLIEPVLHALASAKLGPSDAVAIEKPFGVDLASARRLNGVLRCELPEPTVFRIDHFLSDELVRRVSALRFLNRIFEPVWNATHVERVDVSWLESLTLEGRAGYYDHAGALRDMVQSHLMEVMALVVMEEPSRSDAASYRAARLEALRAVATPTIDEIRSRTLRARYTAGAIGTRRVPSYVDEPGVDARHGTETYASLTLAVESMRWSGVPFTLRSGKAFATSSAEIAIHFRALPRYVVEAWPGVEPNSLRLGLTEPYVRLATTLNGPDRVAESRALELCASPPRRSVYANLILDMLRGDPALFILGEEAEEAWRVIDPVIQAWHASEVPMREYAAGAPAPPSGERRRPTTISVATQAP
ncbi:glucose-6-phosphate dehydrogenase [Sandaracinus amylolyticus]|uniref:glucose-6-phosphate dehydrogenase n=1 Tax=Sandaracinus amylolyticus TaxID=927083 RepID=UPI001F231A3E|nr:glucose-6-phosphate dehydrogenase [Sandaracinus amylolyticus]